MIFKYIAKTTPILFSILVTGICSNLALAQTKPDLVIDRIEQYTYEGREDSINQITNVNRLKDISPTDWSYEAIRSLTERYSMRVPLRLDAAYRRAFLSTRGRIAVYLDFPTGLSKAIALLLVMNLLRV